MSTPRGYALYMFNAQNRVMHSRGHSGIDCTVPDLYDDLLNETHSRHSEFYRNYSEYMALVAQPVIESPQCPKCFSVHPVSMWIPGKAMGAIWVRGATIRECGHCGYRMAYEPDSY